MNINLQNPSLLISAGQAAQFPRRAIPQAALVGRSNVGKSSLVNTLLGRKSLARVSGSPGKTVTVIDPTSSLARKVVAVAEKHFAETGVR